MTTIDRIRALLVKEFRLDPKQLTPEARLEDLGIDSLGMAELVFNMEDDFGLAVPDTAVSLTTLGEVAGFIDELIMVRDSMTASSAPSATLPFSPSQAS